MADDRKTDRYAIRKNGAGWTVYEVWTGEPAIVGMLPQTGLSVDDAKHTANLLNRHAQTGDSSMRK